MLYNCIVSTKINKLNRAMREDAMMLLLLSSRILMIIII